MSLIVLDRLPAEPIEALRELVRAIDECDELKRKTVVAAREAGATWEAIGTALGITRAVRLGALLGRRRRAQGRPRRERRQ